MDENKQNSKVHNIIVSWYGPEWLPYMHMLLILVLFLFNLALN